jgi:hypothetical protein
MQPFGQNSPYQPGKAIAIKVKGIYPNELENTVTFEKREMLMLKTPAGDLFNVPKDEISDKVKVGDAVEIAASINKGQVYFRVLALM